ncbi:hypothetical protein [Butyricicoccus porcorum]|uniref:Uncharacterized protein n=1 Tax=Butyricicoccus porcorum TaxID=1945634 RepID=A0A252F743_9FIRM|nr:hypothetical protein [Butyricicoccus porcorum]MCI6926821.1 hypothetical protein [Butyricicoccus porcorum]MDY4483558.1 hypothetical protein [Butyricicoccus porcorum]OUM21574.1 hypothetical protein CBW42_03145 [Butyricicoccus porcorum]
MFESMKELLGARESLNATNAKIADAEARLQELEEKLTEAQEELRAREETIARKDDIVIAIHKQVTAEREAIVAEYADREAEAAEELEQIEAKLKKAKTYFEDCERQVYCMANLYKAMRAAITKYSSTGFPDDLDITPEEMEEIRLTEESVGLKMHSYKMEDLHKMHEANNKLLEQLLTRYETRLIVPADRVVFQLMTLGIRAELQQIINEMEYGELNRAQVKLHLAVGKYLKIISFAKLDAAEELDAYSSELEVLLKETLRLEHAYCERRTDFERHQELFGTEEGQEESEPEQQPDDAQ